MKKLFFLISICFLLIYINNVQGALKTGDPAPNFYLTGHDGKTYSLNQFKSKVILIEFLSTKCFACDMVIPDINQIHEQFSNENLMVIGILFNDEVEDINKLKEFSKNKVIKYPLFIADVKVKKLYNVYGFPNFVILDEKKQIRQIYRGITKDTFGLLNREIEKILNKGGQ
ncbi:MAG: TlpA disulfide reductase family protein [Thermodesulfovibrio sp.]|uniref:peroxiredoxin family protein n=1 Tax=unclassified Thermodesulfovibrio TaxID=2645936 RepID=UPI00083AE1A7|nr:MULTISPECIES: TlpA disulfide reductase family protein [unclassified Thermodesulfovibrio]MDI1472213.1 TlpA disulfide reductase family protein [Thermodesulfovibrio sp. 1176]MDI6714076.1 TlpA disulfide reductase family protein [Thermodesulfovibrio sp.]